MPEPIAFLNGQWIPASAAAVPIGDAGFVQGVAVAEQLRTFNGELFRLTDHLARLHHSLEIVGIDPGMTLDRLAQVAERLVAHNHPLMTPGDDIGLSIVVTPGCYATFAPPGPTRPFVCLHTYPLPFHLWAKKYRSGQRLATTSVEQVPEQCWPASLKCRSRMHYYLADREARTTDPQSRALLRDAEGFVVEASTANVLLYRADEGLVSPPWEKILHGISLTTALELAQQLGIPCRQRDVSVADVATADEVLLTSTSLCVLPVTHFNSQPIGSGQPGAIFAAMLEAWNARVGLDIAAQAERFAQPIT